MQYRAAHRYQYRKGIKTFLHHYKRNYFVIIFVQQFVFLTVFNIPGENVILQLAVKIWQTGWDKTMC